MSISKQVAFCIINTLTKLNITDFFCAPGHRQAPFVFALEENPLVNTHVFFDERALAFMALGFAKAKGKPVGIITTSGSALANLLPAVIEANQSHVPLILLTADRPYHLQYCGQNQTIEQEGLFSSFVCHSLSLPTFDEKIDSSYLSSSLSFAIAKALKEKRPIQINCPFAKPFFSKAPLSIKEHPPICISSTQSIPCLKEIETAIRSSAKGVIILGSMPGQTNLLPLFQLAKKLNWPIFADLQSPISQFPSPDERIYQYELFLKKHKKISCDCILQFGDRIVSNTLLQWIKNHHGPCIHITSYSSFYDPVRKVTHRAEGCVETLARRLASVAIAKPPVFLHELKKEDNRLQRLVNEYYERKIYFSEKALFHHSLKLFPPQSNVFIANSSPIRIATESFFSKAPLHIFSNRGASGIDGNVSTTLGIHLARPTMTIGILGDLAVLHDLNAFAKAKMKNLHFLIFNNQGGGIFSHLNVTEDKEIFEKYFQTKHTSTFSQIAKQFSLHYKSISSFADLNTLALPPAPTLIECFTSNETNALCQKELFTFLQKEETCHV